MGRTTVRLADWSASAIGREKRPSVMRGPAAVSSCSRLMRVRKSTSS